MAPANHHPRYANGVDDPVRRLQRMAGDARLAAVFKQIRAIIGVSEMEMARRLGTDVAVILDFEAGAVDALPPWPVTAALTERYAALADVDPAPILSRLLSLQTPVISPVPAAPSTPTYLSQAYYPAAPQPQPPAQPPTPYYAEAPVETRRPVTAQPTARASQQSAMPTTRERPSSPRRIPAAVAPASAPQQPQQLRQPPPPEPSAEPVTDAPHLGFASRSKLRTASADAVRTQPATAATDATTKEADDARQMRQRRRLKNTLLAISPLALLVVLFLLVQVAPASIYATARILPNPIGRPLRALVDVMVVQTAPFREGLRWIEPANPRIRKADRLASP